MDAEPKPLPEEDEHKAKARGPIAWMAENSVAANLLMLILVVGGLVMMFQVKQEVFPEFELDLITISVPYPGASPAEVEQGVVLAIEEAVRGVDGIKKVTSASNEGVGMVTVELLLGTDPDRALSDVKSAVDRVTSLPQDAERPDVSLLAVKGEVLSVILYGEQSEETLRVYAERLRNHLLADSRITTVELAGVRQPEISIEVPRENLRRYGLTLEQVANRIRAASVDLPGGAIKTRHGEVLVRTTERRNTGDEFGDVVSISRPDGSEVRVHDIARVRDGFEQTDKKAFFFKQPAAMVKVFRVGEQKPVELADTVRERLETFDLPAGLSARVWADWSEFYADRLDLLVRNAKWGVLLVLAVLGLFLNLKLAFWVTLGIPISFIGSMLVLPQTDVSINMISLFAYIVVLGIVVDDAIVVGEAIFYRRREGMPRARAAIVGARDVAVPVVFSVLTTIIFFVPLLFVPGMMGKFMRVLPIIVISVLALSLIESLFILPAHLAHSTPPKKRGFFGVVHRVQARVSDGLERFVDRVFGPFLRWCLKERYLTMATATAVFISVIGLTVGGYVPFAFFPKIDGDLVFAQVELPYGTSVEDTRKVHDRLVSTAFDLFEDYGGAEDYARGMFHQVGAADNGGINDPMRPGLGAGSHLTEVAIYLAPEEQRPFSSREFTARWREMVGEVPGAEAISFRFDTGSPTGKPVDVQLSHDDLGVLEQAAAELARELESFAGVYDINDGFETGKDQLDFKLRPQARALGLTESDLGRQLRAAFFGAEAVRQQRGRDEVRAYVRLPEAERSSEYAVEQFIVRTPEGGEIPLRQAAKVQRGSSYTRITREDGRRVVHVTGEVDLAVNNGERIANALKADVLGPLRERFPGLSYSMGGQQKDQAETMSSLVTGFILGLFAIYGLLAVVFRSYLQPILVVSVIPFGIIGAVLGHLVMGYYLSMMSFMGMIALSGIVVNDSLVLIVAVNEYKRRGLGTYEALVAGAQRRFRPILLTSATTFLGLLPMLTERSMQARFLIPMAISLAFGVLLATVICPLLVPVVFAIFEDIKAGLGRAWRFVTGEDDDVGPGALDVPHAED